MSTTRPATIVLDGRTLPSAGRNLVILEAFDRLALGNVLELIEDGDPRALRNELLEERPGRFSWNARNLGSGRWNVRVERIDDLADTGTFLIHCPAFNCARAASLRDLAQAATERSYQPGETIYDEGEDWPYLALVRAGKVIYTLLSPDGKTQSLGERLPLDALNETGTFDGGGATTRAEALTACTLVLLPTEAVNHAARGDADLALGFLRDASQARRRSIETIADLAFAHVLQRVAKFLLTYAPATTGMARGLSGVENLSQAQIAQAAGTVRDMAARALLRLKNAGAVELDRGRVRAMERQRLEAFASNVQAPPV